MTINAQYMIDRYGDMVKLKIKKWGADLKMNYTYKNELN